MSSQLSTGCCKLLQTANPEDTDVFENEYTVQFLSVKKVGSNPGAPAGASSSGDRYRIIMSDGVNYMQAMLATQLNPMIQDNSVTKNTIAVLEKLTCNYVQDKRYALRVF